MSNINKRLNRAPDQGRPLDAGTPHEKTMSSRDLD